MSKETLTHLNTQVLIGNTDERGKAWHWRAEEQGDESNHYPGPIPVEHVSRRLFNWTATESRVAVEVPATLETMTHLSEELTPVRWAVQEDRVAITRSDNNHLMGMFKDSYHPHQYDEWLIGSVSNLLGDTLSISSAGLLREGAIAWVEVSVPETLHHAASGYAYRPNCLATTSFDGSIATTIKRTITATVCDNTRAVALSEPGEEFKIKHSKYSGLKISDARQALRLVERAADEFDAELDLLMSTSVTDRQWAKFLDVLVPMEGKEGRSKTMAETKRDGINTQWNSDGRSADWKGTALGAIQAVNTYANHDAIVRGTRAESNMLKTIQGKFEEQDRETWETLNRVLSLA